MKSRWAIPAGLMLVFALPVIGVRGAAPTVAIYAPDPQVQPLEDLLTATLSAAGGVDLVERSRMRRILEEQRRDFGSGSAGGLKAGQLLGADGVIFLALENHGEAPYLVTRLIAVGPGIVLHSTRIPWPVQETGPYLERLVRELAGHWPKLGIPPGRTRAISLLAMRSPLQTRDTRHLEVSLSRLLSHELAQEPEVFVLDRVNLGALSWEKTLSGLKSEDFWSAGWVLEGRIDPDGTDPERLHLDILMTDPRGGKPVGLKAEGPRDNPGRVVERLAMKILETVLQRKVEPRSSDRVAEAVRFLDQADWAWKWGLEEEALVAVEAAESLAGPGFRGGLLATHILSRSRPKRVEALWDWGLNKFAPLEAPGEEPLSKLHRGLTLWRRYQQALAGTAGLNVSEEWVSRGVHLLDYASQALLDWHHVSWFQEEPQPDWVAQARAECRSVAREVASLTVKFPEQEKRLGEILVRYGWLWQDTPEQGAAFCNHLFQSGRLEKHRRSWLLRPLDFSFLPAWKQAHWGRRERILPGLLQDWRQSEDPRLQAEGLALALRSASTDSERYRLLQEVETFGPQADPGLERYLATWALDVQEMVLTLLDGRLTRWQERAAPILRAQSPAILSRWLTAEDRPDPARWQAAMGPVEQLLEPVNPFGGFGPLQSWLDRNRRGEYAFRPAALLETDEKGRVASAAFRGLRPGLMRAYLSRGMEPKLERLLRIGQEAGPTDPEAWYRQWVDRERWDPLDVFTYSLRPAGKFPWRKDLLSTARDGSQDRELDDRLAALVRDWKPEGLLPRLLHELFYRGLKNPDMPSTLRERNAVRLRQVEGLLDAERLAVVLTELGPGGLASLRNRFKPADLPLSAVLRLTPILEARARHWSDAAAAADLRAWWRETGDRITQWRTILRPAVVALQSGEETSASVTHALTFIRETGDFELGEDLVEAAGRPVAALEGVRLEIGPLRPEELGVQLESARMELKNATGRRLIGFDLYLLKSLVPPDPETLNPEYWDPARQGSHLEEAKKLAAKRQSGDDEESRKVALGQTVLIGVAGGAVLLLMGLGVVRRFSPKPNPEGESSTD